MSTPSASVRIVLCDDSPTTARVLSRTLDATHGFEIVGVFATAERAVASVPRLAPDVLIMDVELPGMSGIEAVEQLMATAPLPIVVLSDSADDVRAAALAAGALETVAKQAIGLGQPGGPQAEAFRAHLRQLARTRVISHPRGGKVRRTPRRRIAAVGLCASAGGTQALLDTLRPLSADFAIPVLVVQHMSPGFTASFAERLAHDLELPVRVVDHSGRRIEPGVWLAPEGAHLLVNERGAMVLDSTTEAGYHRPSANVLFESMAQVYGSGAAVGVLSGMGDDGARGLEAVRLAGGLTIAQDEASSTIYGMPRAALERGAQFALPPARIADLLVGVAPSGRQTA